MPWRRAGAKSNAVRAERPAATIEALFEARYLSLCRVAFLMLGDRDAAEQVVMDAFTDTYARWASIRDSDRAEAYLRRAVVNRASTVRRRRATEWRANALFLGRSRVAPDPGAEGWIAREPVLLAIQRLPRRQRATVVLHFYEDLREAEIAEVLGCSVGTVKSQLSKARRKLAQLLAEEPDRD